MEAECEATLWLGVQVLHLFEYLSPMCIERANRYQNATGDAVQLLQQLWLLLLEALNVSGCVQVQVVATLGLEIMDTKVFILIPLFNYWLGGGDVGYKICCCCCCCNQRRGSPWVSIDLAVVRVLEVTVLAGKRTARRRGTPSSRPPGRMDARKPTSPLPVTIQSSSHSSLSPPNRTNRTIPRAARSECRPPRRPTENTWSGT